ncbi:RidA family protein [Actibacterium sp. 188UL27-1]|uniref:RidA family protein n=1 Tax=Actibacterium sp. 188UL27-1 TaxID=2786961 RepID=UPI001958FB09|nr:RidA family protein [Actibacterium sp. 188UL27-1]MBM7066365.1 RidA family protein [Actibacterium sp. 188UL27-1]
MAKKAIIPGAFQKAAEALHLSPGIISGGHVFLSGSTGGDANGHMPKDPGEQMRNTFDKIGIVLAAADLEFDAVVEMTSYHVGLRDHFEMFDAVRLEYLRAPYPAWTAVEVAGLRRIGAIVEVRIIAALPGAD